MSHTFDFQKTDHDWKSLILYSILKILYEVIYQTRSIFTQDILPMIMFTTLNTVITSQKKQLSEIVFSLTFLL